MDPYLRIILDLFQSRLDHRHRVHDSCALRWLPVKQVISHRCFGSPQCVNILWSFLELGDGRRCLKLRSISTVVDVVQGFYLENATADLTFAASRQHLVCPFR